MSSLFNGSMGQSGVDTGDIGHSLRFRGRSASAYASKTFGTPTSQNSWAFSCFVKFSEMPNGSNYQPLLSAGPVGTSTWPGETLYIYQDGTLAYYASTASGTHNVAKRSSRVFRDPTGWVHIFVRKTAAANSGLTFVRLWVNNEEVTSWAANTYTGTQASVPDYINVASTSHVLGRNFAEYLQGYMSRVCFVDNGGSLLPTDFIQFNTEINEWVSKSQSAVKAVVDAGGANSFMLDFDDATSLTTLGNDYSSKNNDWTLNNFSLTAGTSYDRMLDVPGNSFATLNPIYRYGSTTSLTLSEGNLKASGTSLVDRYSASTIGFTSPWYYEITLGSLISGNPACGTINDPLTKGVSYYSSGAMYVDGSLVGTYATYTTGDTLGFAVTPTSNEVKVYKNNTLIYTATSTGCNFVYAYTSNTSDWHLNAGQAPLHASATYHSAAGGYFRYAPPTGYKALCQRNMPDPAILNPELHFDVVTQLGSAVNTGANLLAQFSTFTYALAVGKDRAAANNWQYVDTVRGSTAVLQSNTTAAETTYAAPTSGDNCVAYGWNMASAAVTNNAGSISSQVSANVEAGFSIVTATSDGANPFTVGHGLGQTPAFYIVKNRDIADGWYCGHKNLASATDSYLLLNGTGAVATAAGIWGAGANSTTLGIRGSSIAANGQKIVAYCFAEIPGFSKAFSYTGNGSADGPFVHCGFKPKFILLKNASAAGNGWIIYDAVRNTYNVMDFYLQPNTSSAEGAAAYIDAVSNGFKVRTANADANGSTNTIVGIAFADVPAKYSLVR